ncbi:putative Ran GDP binding protein [Trypanosoma conorhini]|uniref:Putative Ran GDP binding protein n=1 Tax=Trypanosoma conorhini TaxID=83891 RepID=A0A3R7NMD3_9TRYP|nr:putative Ran GDP binding protein [Trypanosoma conorhini]RNF24077.1 putative Ran GDP binding protein [Trypanosoma conorhini]
MRRLASSWCFLLAAERTVRTASLFFRPGTSFLEEDLEDEERLAQLLVQGAPTVAAATPAPLPVSPATDFPTCTASVTTSAAAAVAEMGANTAEEATLANDMFLGDEDAASPQRGGLPIRVSRLENQQLAKYAHIRCSMHAKLVKEGAEPVVGPALEWMCVRCRTYNFVGRKSCRRCNQRDVESFKHNSPPARHIPLFPSVWTCHFCGCVNRSEPNNACSRNKFFCDGCGKRFAGVREWYCPSCHCINSRGATQCATCYSERPHCWTCSSCKYEKNSVFATECRSCHVSCQKQVSDSTVLCPTCRQRNDAQWEMCFFCMTPLGMMLSVRRLQERLVDGVKETAKILPSEAEDRAGNGGGEEGCQEPTTPEPPPTTCVEAEAAAAGEEGKMPTTAFPSPEQQEERIQKHSAVECQQKQCPTCEQVSPTGEEQIPELAGSEEGTWWCDECQVLQRRNAGFCDICLKPKALAKSGTTVTRREGTMKNERMCETSAPQKGDASLGSKPEEAGEERRKDQEQMGVVARVLVDTASASPSVGDTGQWRCPYCRKMVNVMEMSCCGVPREIPFGYWLCTTCCSTNRDERAKCMGCGAAPPAKPWRCFLCRFRNRSQDLFCDHCGSAHPHHWECAKCGAKCQHASHGRCSSCGAGKPSQEIITCPTCCAPNRPSRKSCYRCRGRLSSDRWHCGVCGSTKNDRQARRCEACGSPREYNMNEVTWICDVCDTAVASGGALPERTQCPRCWSERTERSLCLPSRWRCQGCGLVNVYALPACAECGGKRLLERLRTHTTCPSCFRITSLTEQEQCGSCGADFSSVINEAGTPVSLSGLSSLLAAPPPPISPAEGSLQAGCVRDTASPTAERETASSAYSAAGSAWAPKRCVNEQPHEAESLVEGNSHMEAALGGRVGTSTSTVSSPSTGAGAASQASSLRSSHTSGVNGPMEEMAEEDEEEVDLEGVRWGSEIPSWMCGNCETTNLEEAETCVFCGLRRGDE